MDISLSISLMQQIGALFIMIGVGYLIVRKGVCSLKDSKVLSALVLYVSAPCVIINSFQIKLNSHNIRGFILAIVAAVVFHFVFIVLVTIIGKIFKFNAIEKTSIIYPNAGNLIIPVVQVLFGPKMLFYCSGAMVVQTILLWTHCRYVISQETNFDLKKIFFNINILSILIGLFLFISQIRFPVPITSAMTSLGNLMGPLSMIVVGMLLAKMPLKEVFTNKRAYMIAFIRLIIFPLIALTIFVYSPLRYYVSNGSSILLLSLLGASAPSASTVTQFAQVYDNHPFEASIINTITVIFCIITMPLIIMIYQFLI